MAREERVGLYSRYDIGDARKLRCEEAAEALEGIFWRAAFAREWRGGDRRRVRYRRAVTM
jgi:hypothetical protein